MWSTSQKTDEENGSQKIVHSKKHAKLKQFSTVSEKLYIMWAFSFLKKKEKKKKNPVWVTRILLRDDKPTWGDKKKSERKIYEHGEENHIKD
jgi:hypothetical protein